ncbi:hypothetical protein THAOC_15736 [Thalassiosira oceanica]|uniref:Uncharacterized protein n=1 Tax=Thalassiosira oceanica TaxID=159749 RepID=K0SE02_THAOC|nr:hypothetical protein THAOC_15736 [Thalassiosira oceanica]|eukprot:EJK63595.1 hypothetical protein THAOC_15736 [Thalassiosira oceanica]
MYLASSPPQSLPGATVQQRPKTLKTQAPMYEIRGFQHCAPLFGVGMDSFDNILRCKDQQLLATKCRAAQLRKERPHCENCSGRKMMPRCRRNPSFPTPGGWGQSSDSGGWGRCLRIFCTLSSQGDSMSVVRWLNLASTHQIIKVDSGDLGASKARVSAGAAGGPNPVAAVSAPVVKLLGLVRLSAALCALRARTQFRTLALHTSFGPAGGAGVHAEASSNEWAPFVRTNTCALIPKAYPWFVSCSQAGGRQTMPPPLPSSSPIALALSAHHPLHPLHPAAAAAAGASRRQPTELVADASRHVGAGRDVPLEPDRAGAVEAGEGVGVDRVEVRALPGGEVLAVPAGRGAGG